MNELTAPAAVRDRFWIDEAQRCRILVELGNVEGVSEAVLLVTARRLEFFLWASDPGKAADAVVTLLTRECGLRLSEWQFFYRLLEDLAVWHVFRVAAGLEPPTAGDPQIASQLEAAWQHARKIGTARAYLSKLLERALHTGALVREYRAKDLLAQTPAMQTSGSTAAPAPGSERGVASLIDASAREFNEWRAARLRLPLSVALRAHFEGLARKELASLRQQLPTLPLTQQQLVDSIVAAISRNLADALAEELSALSDASTPQQIRAALERLSNSEGRLLAASA